MLLSQVAPVGVGLDQMLDEGDGHYSAQAGFVCISADAVARAQA
jgi:hypothetical protein